MPNESILKSVRAFLHYALRDIAYDYNQLTPEEKALVTREEFAEMTEWLNKLNKHG